MLLAMIYAAPWALAEPASFSVDLDGDGEAETVEAVDEVVRIGAASLTCGGASFPCIVEIEDIRGDDRFKEVSVCELGPRDDRYCSLYAYAGGALTEIELTIAGEEYFAASDVVTSGNGIVLADNSYRFYVRRDKFVIDAARTRATHVPQPYYHVDYAVQVDRTFPITMSPGAGATVANVRPGSTITIVLRDAAKPDYVLLRISSGLTGWVALDDLVSASDHMMRMMAAG